MQDTTSDSRYMTEALNQARVARKLGDLPFGAVVVCDDQLVGRGKCENNTTGDVTDHAEMVALRQACRSLGSNILKECTIYCTNEPCPMCAAAIFQAKIAQVVVGLTRDDLPQLLRPRNILMKQLAEDSGYPVQIRTGVMKEDILAEFRSLRK